MTYDTHGMANFHATIPGVVLSPMFDKNAITLWMRREREDGVGAKRRTAENDMIQPLER